MRLILLDVSGIAYLIEVDFIEIVTKALLLHNNIELITLICPNFYTH